MHCCCCCCCCCCLLKRRGERAQGTRASKNKLELRMRYCGPPPNPSNSQIHEGRVGVLEPACQARTPGAALKLMHFIARRVSARLAASTPEAIFGQGIQLYAAGQYQTAAARFEAAAALGHACARAELAWLLLMGREGVAVDEVRALQLTEEGWCLGCMQSAGVLAWCCMMGCGSPRRHARAAARKGERCCRQQIWAGSGRRHALVRMGWTSAGLRSST